MLALRDRRVGAATLGDVARKHSLLPLPTLPPPQRRNEGGGAASGAWRAPQMCPQTQNTLSQRGGTGKTPPYILTNQNEYFLPCIGHPCIFSRPTTDYFLVPKKKSPALGIPCRVCALPFDGGFRERSNGRPRVLETLRIKPARASSSSSDAVVWRDHARQGARTTRRSSTATSSKVHLRASRNDGYHGVHCE